MRNDPVQTVDCALVLLANAFPVVGVNMLGQCIDATVIGAAIPLWQDSVPAVSIMVVATTTLTPLLKMTAIIWLVLPLRPDRRPPGFARVFRALMLHHPRLFPQDEGRCNQLESAAPRTADPTG